MAVTGFFKLGPTPKLANYADQGNYFVATNPTPGAGLISSAQTTLADTAPLLIVKNNNAVNSGVRIYLDTLKLTVTVIGVGGTLRNLTTKLDTSQTTARYTSGGTSIGAGVNTNADSGTASNAQVYFGAITAAAAGSARLIHQLTLREVLEVAQDTYVIDFGPSVSQATAYLATAAGATTSRYFQHPPVVIGPQEHFLMHYWGGSASTGTTFEFNLGWIEV